MQKQVSKGANTTSLTIKPLQNSALNITILLHMLFLKYKFATYSMPILRTSVQHYLLLQWRIGTLEVVSPLNIQRKLLLK